MKRCKWAEHESLLSYHDKEWGVPVKTDRKHFEMITLEGAQAGLSWSTILKRRQGYKKAFHNFEVKKVSKMTDKDVIRLMKDKGIIRNRLKIESTISNSKVFMEIQKEFGSFNKYIWKFVGGSPLNNKVKTMKDIQSTTSLSEEISKDMKKRGFRFVGSTIIYAYMQAIGIVNDHEMECFRYKKC